jgi:hypothetical protein
MKVIFIAILLLGYQAGIAQQNADLIVTNAKIATMAKAGEFVQAVAMKDGMVLATGTSAKILADFKNTEYQSDRRERQNGGSGH